MSAPFSKLLELVMLASAQECVYLRGLLDNKSEGILSKLASQAGDLFDQAYDAASSYRGGSKTADAVR